MAYQSILGGQSSTTTSNPSGSGYSSIFSTPEDEEKRRKKRLEDMATEVDRQRVQKEVDRETLRKDTENKAKETVRKRSVFESFGDVFEANSPEDIAKREARGEKPKYQDQKAYEKIESDRFKKFDFNKDDIDARREQYSRSGVNIDEFLANKRANDAWAPNSKKELARLTRENKIPEEVKRFEEAKDKAKKAEKGFQKFTKTAEGRDNLAEMLDRRFTRGGASMIAGLPGDVQALAGTALGAVTPAGSRLDKLAQGTYEAGKARKARTDQQIIDRGFGVGPRDGIVGNLAEGVGNLTTAAALTPILGVPGLATKGKGIVSAVKTFLKPGGVGSVFGTSKAGDIVVEAKDKGKSDIGALARALPAGYAEAILENFGLGKLFGQKGNVALAFVRQSFIEGTQEALQDTTTNLIRKTYTDVPFDEIISQGIESFLYGAAIGGPAGTIASVANNVSSKLQEQGVPPAEADQVGQVVEDSINTKLVEKGTEEATTKLPDPTATADYNTYKESSENPTSEGFRSWLETNRKDLSPTAINYTVDKFKKELTPIPTETKPEVVAPEKPKGSLKPIAKPSVVPAPKPKGSLKPLGKKAEVVTKPKTDKLQSRVYARLKEEHPDELKDDVSYTAVNLKRDADSAVKLVETDRNQAFRIAMGAEELPGQTSTAVSIALSEKALQDENYTLYAQLVKTRSLMQTRRGQEIVAEKGSVSNNTLSRYVRELVNARLEKLGKGYLSGLRLGRKKGTSQQKAIEAIDKEVTKMEKRITNRGMDLQSAQALIDRLAC